MKNTFYPIGILLLLSACAAPLIITKNNIELNSILVDDKIGFIDQKGKVRIEPQYEKCTTNYEQFDVECPYHLFQEGVAIIKVNNKYGVVNWKNEVVIEPKYNYLEDEYNGNFIAQIDSNYGVINSQGEIVVPFIFKEIFLSSDSLVPTRYNNKAVIYNRLDNSILELPYENIYPFFNGYAEVWINNKKGLVDKNGKVFLKPEYDELKHYKEGPMAVKQGDNWFFLNRNKKKFLDSTYSYLSQFEDGFAVVKKEKYGVIDRNGNTIIPFIYEFLQNEGKGIFKFSSKEKYYQKEAKHGLINNKNEVILEQKYSQVYYSQHSGNASVRDTLTELEGIINVKKNKVLIPLQFTQARYYKDGLSRLEFNDEEGNLFFGYINRYKKIIWSNNVPLLKKKLSISS